jgi:hypothetical protein
MIGITMNTRLVPVMRQGLRPGGEPPSSHLVDCPEQRARCAAVPLGIHLMRRVRVVRRRPARVIVQVADSTQASTMAVAWIAADLIFEGS